MDTLKPITTDAGDAASDAASEAPPAANGVAPSGNAQHEAQHELKPGRKMPFEEALEHTLAENAELYRRLA